MGSVGRDTFRGTFGSTASRQSLYSKNGGERSPDNTCTMYRVESPVSGNLLITPLSRNRPSVRDPISGTPMRYCGNVAVVTTPGQVNQFSRCRRFFISRDVDVTIQTLRNTTKVSKYTNERVGTAGTPTGMDRTLQVYKNVVQ